MLAGAAGSAGASGAHPPLRQPVHGATGTVVLVHSGGWAGPSRAAQRELVAWPGAVFRAAGWTTISIDYAAGAAGLRSVLGQLRRAMKAPGGHRVCVYGESAGGHLALLAAARLPRLECVVAFDAPTDFAGWHREAKAVASGLSLAVYRQTVRRWFGGPLLLRRWEPVTVARRIRARVLLVAQADDRFLPVIGQIESFLNVRPATDVHITAAGASGDPREQYLHGTLSPTARAELSSTLATFVTAAPSGHVRGPRRGDLVFATWCFSTFRCRTTTATLLPSRGRAAS